MIFAQKPYTINYTIQGAYDAYRMLMQEHDRLRLYATDLHLCKKHQQASHMRNLAAANARQAEQFRLRRQFKK